MGVLAILLAVSVVVAVVALFVAVADLVASGDGDTRRRSRAAAIAGVAVMASMLPMGVGFVGTLVALVTSFSAVAVVDPARKATVLAGGISDAMNLTVVRGDLYDAVDVGVAGGRRGGVGAGVAWGGGVTSRFGQGRPWRAYISICAPISITCPGGIR